ncbi:MAG TPA: DMT family transporter [Gammaproteobacteria bacterium]|nr:DMT family transporter [Gammaproteobacteria bacterium]
MLIPSIFIVLWSSGAIFVENGLKYSDPFIFLSLRLWLAWSVVGLILFFTRPEFPKSFQQLSWMSLTGMTQGLYSVFFFVALYEGISPGILAIILGMQPLLTLLVMREAMRPLQMVGILLGFIGLALTVINTVMTGVTSVWGIINALLSLGAITLSTIWQKKYCSSISLTANLFIQYLASSILVTLIYAAFGNRHVDWRPGFIVSLLWVALVISIAAIYLFYHLLKRGKAANVTSYLYCVPPVTAVMDYLMFKHVLSLTTVFGMMLVIMGLALIHYKHYGRFSSQQKTTDKRNTKGEPKCPNN